MKKNRCIIILFILTKNKNNKKGFHQEAFFICINLKSTVIFSNNLFKGLSL